MTVLTLTVCLALYAEVLKNEEESVADSIQLRGGETVVGTILERSPKEGLSLIVRRAWAKQTVPALYESWEKQEAAVVRRASETHRSRLESWKRDRSANPEPDDRVSRWIEAELARLDARDAEPTQLMIVCVKPAEVRQVTRRPTEMSRLLRLAWRCRFANPEKSTVGALQEELRDRGLDTEGREQVSLDDLLPPQPESEDHWLARRAATEVAHDRGLRFVTLGPMLMPEPGSNIPQFRGFPAAMSAGAAGIPGFRDGQEMIDRQLRAVVERKRVGAVVTRHSNSSDLDAVTAEITLWVRLANGRWKAWAKGSATVRAAELKPDELSNQGDNVQIQTSFSFSQSFGFGPGGTHYSETRQSHPNLGAATRKAQSEAKAAFLKEMGTLELKVD